MRQGKDAEPAEVKLKGWLNLDEEAREGGWMGLVVMGKKIQGWRDPAVMVSIQ